jgi:hypothetical protein
VFGSGVHRGRRISAEQVGQVGDLEHFGQPDNHLQAGTALASLDLSQPLG